MYAGAAPPFLCVLQGACIFITSVQTIRLLSILSHQSDCSQCRGLPARGCGEHDHHRPTVMYPPSPPPHLIHFLPCKALLRMPNAVFLYVLFFGFVRINFAISSKFYTSPAFFCGGFYFFVLEQIFTLSPSSVLLVLCFVLC